MKKIPCLLSSIIYMSVSFAPMGNAYFIGSDKFTAQDYKKAEIEFEHKIFSKDVYKFLGQTISQKQAEMLTDLYKRVFDDVEPNGQENETSKKTYLKAARIFLEYTDKLYQKIEKLKRLKK